MGDRVGGVRVRAAEAGDLKVVRALLVASELPLDGLTDHFPGGYVVARRAEGDLVGVAGVEVFGDAGLLRSVAVAASLRGTGLGRALVEDRVQWASLRGLGTLYLLTSTAADFFARLGFERVARESVRDAVRASLEFTSVCPVSATVMAREMDQA